MSAPTYNVVSVCFFSSFRLSGERGGVESPNINHALNPEKTKTLCGRTGWVTEEASEPVDNIACRRCLRAIEKRATEGGAA
jgi:hypothetical protein